MNPLTQLPSDEPGLSEAVYQAQTDLLRLVDQLMMNREISTPIELINNLLDHWLTNPADDLFKDVNPHQLQVVH